jgi:hypothetical protein
MRLLRDVSSARNSKGIGVSFTAIGKTRSRFSSVSGVVSPVRLAAKHKL